MEPIVGIVAEYNPFHNGHLYQLREAKRRSGADCAVAVMSGNFVQRGAPAAADKWERAASAAACGADLVLELPFFYACNSAELFAEGGIGILRGLGCVTHLSFGCETQCPELLKAAADVLAEEPAAFRQQLRVFLDRGESYPKARWEALRAVCGQKTASVIESPNNILAVEYLKQCIRQGWNPEYVPVFRKGASYDEKQLSGETASAAALRESYDGFCAEDPDKRDAGAWKKTIERFLPEISLDMLLQKGASKQKLEEGLYLVLISKILTAAPEELGELVSAGEGLQNRLKKAALRAESIEELVQLVKSKRYTETRIRRFLIHIVFGLTQQAEGQHYARVLAFNAKGAALLRKIKKEACAQIPVLTNVNKELEKNSPVYESVKLDFTASEIYHLIRGEALYFNSDYVRKPIFADEIVKFA